MGIYWSYTLLLKPLVLWALATFVSRKSAHRRSTLQVCQRGGWVLFQVFPHLTMKERPCHVYSDSLNALEENNWTKNNIQWNYQWLWSWVLMAYNTLNGAVSLWTWFSLRFLSLPQICTALKAVLLRVHSWSSVGAHLSKIWSYTGKWAKNRGWVLFCETT